MLHFDDGHHRMEQCVVLGTLHIAAHDCCWDSWQGPEQRNFAEESPALQRRAQTRMLQLKTVLADYVGHCVAKPRGLFYSRLCILGKHDRFLEHRGSLDDRSRYLGQSTLGHGRRAVDLDHSRGHMGIDCSNIRLCHCHRLFSVTGWLLVRPRAIYFCFLFLFIL